MVAQKLVRYDLYVRDTIVNFAGVDKRAIAVNGQIPMPTLFFHEGDTAEIEVHNLLNEPTSLHWHGLFLPNKEDGVPFLTQLPIEPNSSYTYRFPIIQNGTHWYHSHSGLQEQIGMYGNFVILKKEGDPSYRQGIDDLPSIPIVLSEWTNYRPENVHRMLHNATDWFAIKKNATQSYSEAIRAGHFNTKVTNEWKRMLAMDVSDIYYDKILINGKNVQNFEFIDGTSVKPGDKVRLRISNGGASSYFWLSYAGGKITVVANDGNDIEPVEVDRLIIAVSETYDIVITLPTYQAAFEFLITTEDRTNSASIFLGSGLKKLASPLPKLKYFEGMKMMNDMMRMNGELNDMGMSMSLNRMDMNTVMYPEVTGSSVSENHGSINESHLDENLPEVLTLNYSMLKSTENTVLPNANDVKVIRLELSGNMNRYVWSLDNKVLSETDKILVNEGENLRLILYNGSMMRHPMHLHGHDFRVVNGQGDYAPLKNVIDIMPMETDTIEFYANATGDWFFHCHILYHMMSGMGRIISYSDQIPNPNLPNVKRAFSRLKAEDKKFHFMARNDIASNGNDGMVMLQNTRWSIGTEWRLGYNDHHGYETETHIGRYFGQMQWLMGFVGFDWRYRSKMQSNSFENVFLQPNTKDHRNYMSAGIEYTLPMLILLQAEVYYDGNIRIQLMREDIPVSKRLRAGFMINSDKEYMFEMGYILGKNIGLRTHYDSDMGFGLGVSFNY